MVENLLVKDGVVLNLLERTDEGENDEVPPGITVHFAIRERYEFFDGRLCPNASARHLLSAYASRGCRRDA